MGRTRSALLTATAECVARYGIRKTTMVDVASKSGVAKATLYNHFRTKDDVLAAVVEQQVADLVGACVTTASSSGLVDALQHAAQVIAAHPALRKAADGEQQLLAPLLTPAGSRGWQLAREGVAAVLSAGSAPSSPAEVETVLRWCVSQVLWPLPGEEARAGAEALARGLGARTAPGPVPVPPAPRNDLDSSSALGWPT
jgi:AcrR family transcriptional regulator